MTWALALIFVLSVACNWPIYLMLAADPNLVARRQIRQWAKTLPKAADVRLSILEN